MRRINTLALAAIAAVLATVSVAARADNSMMMSSGMKPVIFTPSTVKWEAGTGEFKGLTVAWLSGDPTKAGPWTVRLKAPAGAKFPVHYHNDTEMVTVISGTFYLGLGDTVDMKKAKALPAGGFHYLPAKAHHYAYSKARTIVQVSGAGPFDINYLNPADDPQKKM